MTFKPSRIIAGVMNWGVWGSDLSITDMARLVEGCLDIGVDTFDHADIYGGHTTEATFGDALVASGVDRSKIKLITKCGIMMPSNQRPNIKAKHYDTSKDHMLKSVDQSLSNLKTDYIDLLLIHRPSPLMDPKVISETVNELLSAGKILYFGVSNFTPCQVALLHKYTPVSANQIEVSPYALEPLINGQLAQCMSENLLPLAWSPLAAGKIFGKLSDYDEISTRERLKAVAEKYGWTIDQMIYLFLLHHPSRIHPITGSSKLDRIQVAVDAANLSIKDNQWFEIFEACRGHEVA